MSQPNLADLSDLSEPSEPTEPAQEEEQPTLEPTLESPTVEVPTQKQKTDIYTVLLIISFICIVTACILLYAELTMWGSYPWWNTNEATPNVQSYYQPPAITPQSGPFFV